MIANLPKLRVESMQNAIAVAAVILALVVAGRAAYYFKDPQPLVISYDDLSSEAKRQVECLTDNIYFEARNEPVKGQKAVAIVTMNRVNAPEFPSTACGVVKQQDRSICQFTWWCDPNLRNKSVTKNFSGRELEVYHKIRQVALNVYVNHQRVKDVTYGALFYHATYVDRRLLGVKNIEVTTIIGQHIFYRMIA